MKIYLLTPLFLILLYSPLNAQHPVQTRIGLGINASSLSLKKTQVQFENPHMIGFGFEPKIGIAYPITNRLSLETEPTLSLMTSNDIFEIERNTVSFILPFKFRYRITPHFSSAIGAKYQRLLSFQLYNGMNRADLTWFANHRNFINPCIDFFLTFNRQIGVSTEFTYATNDTFNSGAYDQNQNIIGPLKAFQHYFSLSFWYGML